VVPRPFGASGPGGPVARSCRAPSEPRGPHPPGGPPELLLGLRGNDPAHHGRDDTPSGPA